MVTSEVQRSSLQCILKGTKEKRELGESPQKIYGTMSFQSKESFHFDIKRAPTIPSIFV